MKREAARQGRSDIIPISSHPAYRGNSTRCHICRGACEREVEPAITRFDANVPHHQREVVVPAVFEPDVWTVVLRNGMHASVCHPCWFSWPDDSKLYPEEGFGRGGAFDWVAFAREMKFEAERKQWNAFYEALMASPDVETFEAMFRQADDRRAS